MAQASIRPVLVCRQEKKSCERWDYSTPVLCECDGPQTLGSVPCSGEAAKENDLAAEARFKLQIMNEWEGVGFRPLLDEVEFLSAN